MASFGDNIYCDDLYATNINTTNINGQAYNPGSGGVPENLQKVCTNQPLVDAVFSQSFQANGGISAGTQAIGFGPSNFGTTAFYGEIDGRNMNMRVPKETGGNPDPLYNKTIMLCSGGNLFCERLDKSDVTTGSGGLVTAQGGITTEYATGTYAGADLGPTNVAGDLTADSLDLNVSQTENGGITNCESLQIMGGNLTLGKDINYAANNKISALLGSDEVFFTNPDTTRTDRSYPGLPPSLLPNNELNILVQQIKAGSPANNQVAQIPFSQLPGFDLRTIPLTNTDPDLDVFTVAPTQMGSGGTTGTPVIAPLAANTKIYDITATKYGPRTGKIIFETFGKETDFAAYVALVGRKGSGGDFDDEVTYLPKIISIFYDDFNREGADVDKVVTKVNNLNGRSYPFLFNQDDIPVPDGTTHPGWILGLWLYGANSDTNPVPYNVIVVVQWVEVLTYPRT